MKEQTKPKELKGKPITGAFKVLRSNLYKSHMIYIRQFKNYYFEYLLEYNGEIYSGYIIITPEGKSRRKLTDQEVSEAAAVIYSGAMATLDMLLGDRVSKMEKETAEVFEEHRKDMEKIIDKEKKDARKTK
jgi:hypothetical protein